ncbi:MAG TPA: family 20 glycosylhydrolase [Puia sp.]|nr:family 20 glycosylhydrolase [Puia sp.]
MPYYISLIFLMFIFSPVIAQPNNTPAFPVKDLNIQWEAVQNDYQNKPVSLNAVTITNTSSIEFPGKGWKMYFNSARLITPAAVTGNARIELMNGDLFSLTPSEDFPILKPGASVRIEFVAEEPVVNITDGPEGFYLVWDAMPGKGFSTGPVVIHPFKPNYKGLITPAIIYDQNKNIRNIPAEQLTKIFPTPTSYQEASGYFDLKNNIRLVSDERFKKEKEGLITTLVSLLGKNIVAETSGNSISLEFKDGLPSEAYELEVKTNSIAIRASGSAGIFYGIQSLKTLIPPDAWARPQKSFHIPAAIVKDEPRFGYRAFMLDVGRNFQPKKEVLKLLDVMALYKLNVFHFHLTEDEGWRLEIPSLPELTEVGSNRGHTLDSKSFLPPSHGSGPDISKVPGSGYYNRADFIEILRYANDRHILVLPEIETPGHARAAIKSMNARYERLMHEGKKEDAERFLLYDPADQSKYSSNQYWNDNIMDPSLPSTYNFIETVINDIVDIYKEAGVPLKSIHFGGDEVPDHVWEKSPAYLALKVSHPEIQNTGDLWYYFYGRVNQLVKAKGLYLSGWEEMGLRKTSLDGNSMYLPNPDFEPEHLQTEVWNNTLGGGNEDLAYKLANGGYKVVLTCVTNLYFDMANYKSFDEPGYYWGAFTDIDKPFSFIPFDYFKNSTVDKDGLPLNRKIFTGKQRLTDYGKSNIVGLQSAVWGENIKSEERFEYMLLPRLLGFAERAWAKDPDWATIRDTSLSMLLYQQAWSSFLNVVGKRELPMLDYYLGGYGYRIPKPGLVFENGQFAANIQFPGLVIRYSLDGRDPDASSNIYSDPVTDKGKGIKLRAFDTRGRSGAISNSLP